MKKITIAIDGYAGCGKSTTAREVARRLEYLYIDTGAMYRAVSLYFLEHAIPFDTDGPEMKDALDNIYLSFRDRGENQAPAMYLNGRDVSEAIRGPEVSAIVSPVSVHASVRRELVSQQRSMGKEGGVVMDGRDIGTVVFPNAELKVFMTANLEVRARRRQAELKARGIQMNWEEIVHNLQERDRIDTTRAVGPLKQAADAVVLDTTDLDFEEQVDRVCQLAVQLVSNGVR